MANNPDIMMSDDISQELAPVQQILQQTHQVLPWMIQQQDVRPSPASASLDTNSVIPPTLNAAQSTTFPLSSATPCQSTVPVPAGSSYIIPPVVGPGTATVVSSVTQQAVPTPNAIAAGGQIYLLAAAAAAGLESSLSSGVGSSNEPVKRCHMHNKPQLTCKFCRKYKSVVHQQARLLQQQDALRPQQNDNTWTSIEMTNTTTYNLNNLLREKILASEYFKSLYGLKSCEEVIEEIFNYADHAEPYCSGNSRAPSTLFCCLYKLFTLRLKEHEIQLLLDHTDSTYIRIVGFLYLRFVLPPEKMWEWYAPYFLDDEPCCPGGERSHQTTIGEYVESLITEDRYFSTVLPRIPVKIKAEYGAQLMSMASHRRRKALNKTHLEQFRRAVPVAACVSRQLKRREERATRRLQLGLRPLVKRQRLAEQAESSSVEEGAESPSGGRSTTSRSLSRSLEREGSRKRSTSRGGSGKGGSKKIIGRSSSPGRRSKRKSLSPISDRGRGDLGKDHSYNRRYPREGSSDNRVAQTQKDLLLEFRRRESAKALSSGKEYARRPSSYKSSLSVKFEQGRKREASYKRSQSPPVLHVETPSSVVPEAEGHSAPSFTHQKKMAELMQRTGTADDWADDWDRRPNHMSTDRTSTTAEPSAVLSAQSQRNKVSVAAAAAEHVAATTENNCEINGPPSLKLATASESSSHSTHSNVVSNRFSNDGSFLAMILAQQQRDSSASSAASRAPASSATSAAVSPHVGPGSKKVKKKLPGRKSGGSVGNKKKSGAPSSKPGCASPVDVTAEKYKNEFLSAMQIMEEAGLVSEKGIGAGMVK